MTRYVPFRFRVTSEEPETVEAVTKIIENALRGAGMRPPEPVRHLRVVQGSGTRSGAGRYPQQLTLWEDE